MCVPARRKKRAAHRNFDNEKREETPKLKSRRTQNGEVGTEVHNNTHHHNGTHHQHNNHIDHQHNNQNGRLLVTPTSATVAGHEAGVLTISEQKVADGCSTDHCAFCFDVLLNFFDERFGFPSDRSHYFARCSFVK